MKNMESGDLQVTEESVDLSAKSASQPSLLLRVMAWTYPVFYLLWIIIIWSLFALPLRTFELVTGEPVEYQAFASTATILFFPVSIIVMFFKSSWCRKRFVPLLLVWMLISFPMIGSFDSVLHGFVNKAMGLFAIKKI